MMESLWWHVASVRLGRPWGSNSDCVENRSASRRPSIVSTSSWTHPLSAAADAGASGASHHELQDVGLVGHQAHPRLPRRGLWEIEPSVSGPIYAAPGK
jgi:hypothetical protein